MHLFASICRTALLTVLTTGVVSAQTVKGRLFEASTDQPIVGAFVILLNSAGEEFRRVLTDAEGRFVVQAPSRGVYALQAERIGFRSMTSPLIKLRNGEVLEYRMDVPLEPIKLSGISIEAERRCVVRPEEGARTAQVWDEARKALEGVRWSERRGQESYEIFRYRRELDPRTFVVRSEESKSGWRRASQPFVTPPADTLVEKGFVQRTEDGPAFYAPDAGVLLSDVFLDSHCFRVRLGKGKDAGRVGLAFEPTPGRQVPDVSGVLWLDERTAELSYIEYRYTGLDLPDTGLDLPVLTDRFGGLLEFERRPTGAWITKRWWIRGPLVGAQWAWWRGAERQDFLAAIMEEGGEVIRIRDPTHDPAAGTVVGTVFDSTQMQPLAGAKVYLSGTVHFDTTDVTGTFRIEEVAPGDYSVGFIHPRIYSLKYYNVLRPVSVERSDETRVDLSIPTMMRVIDTRLTRFRHGLARFSEPDSLRVRLNKRMSTKEAQETWNEMYPLYRGFLVTGYDCSISTICEIYVDRSEWASISKKDKQNAVLLLGESLSKLRKVSAVMFVSSPGAGGVSLAVFFADKGEGAIEREG